MEGRVPLYEYRCKGCGERFEVLQRVGARPEDTVCPRCDWPSVEREVSVFSSGAATAGGGCAPRGRFT
jgi:putative FmdB family regulatory protein